MVEYPPRRLYLNWNDGDIDINLAPANVPEIKDRAFVSQESLYDVIVNSYRLKKTKKIRSLLDYSDSKIGTYYQYSYVGLKNDILSKAKNLEILDIQDRGVELKLLKKNRIDYLVEYNLNIPLSDEDQKIIEVDKLERVPLHFLVNKSLPNGERLRHLLDAALRGK